jgi:hypothetical protein
LGRYSRMVNVEVILTLVVVGLIVFWRFRCEPRWVGVVRIVLATLILWGGLVTWESHARFQRLREREATGNTRDRSYDTGGGAVVMLLGWIPAGTIVALLWGIRWSIIRVRRRHDASPELREFGNDENAG